jgi:hypothetical protein
MRFTLNNYLNAFIKSLDLFLFIVVCAFFISDFISHFVLLIDKIYSLPYDGVCCMTDIVSNTGSNHNTNVNVVHDDGNWSNAIRSLFIYGTGAFRLSLIKGGNPASRAFVIGTTVASDLISKALTNTINDPSYVK